MTLKLSQFRMIFTPWKIVFLLLPIKEMAREKKINIKQAHTTAAHTTKVAVTIIVKTTYSFCV